MLNKLKKTFDYALFVSALTMAFSAGITAQTDRSLPTLRGSEALEQLKQNGQYDSLKEAVKAARKDDEQTNNEPTENIIQETDKLFASDGGTFDFLGTTMGMSGDTVIIGSYGDDVNGNDDQGSAYIFVRSGATWTQQAKLIASDGTAGDQFGTSVAISGNTVIIGAPADTNGSAQSLGSVYIYVRSGTTWTLQRKFTGTNGLSRQYFGQSVTVSDDTAIVGAIYDNVTPNGGQGAAYVFVRSGTTWTQQAKLAASDGALNDYFGISLAISGETVVVGANGDDVGTITDQGSAYVFVRSGTTWTQQAKLAASDGATIDQFGTCAAIAGDTIIIGVTTDDVGANNDQGSAYVFNRSGTTWTQQQKLTAPDGEAGDAFGSAVAISGDLLAVGVYRDNIGTTPDQGSVRIFFRSGTTWTYDQRMYTGRQGEALGASVVISEDTLIAGAAYGTLQQAYCQGYAAVFRNPNGSLVGPNWLQETRKAASDGADNDFFGSSVAISGDTALVSATGDDVGNNFNQGSVYVFARQGAAWVEQQKLIASDGAIGDGFGQSVAVSGNKAIVGAFGDNIGANADQGSVYIFVRSGTNWTEQQKLTASDGAANDRFGSGVAISGGTLIVGAPYSTNQGAAYVFIVSNGSWIEQQKLTPSDAVGSKAFGNSVSIAGDTVIVGAYLDSLAANSFQGSAYIFVRSAGIWTEQQKLTAPDGAADDQFGWSVGISGDTAIVGAYWDDIGANTNQGSAYVFVRAGTIWTLQRKLTALDGSNEDKFGYSVGISDNKIVVGAYWDDVGNNPNQGTVYIFNRLATDWTQQRVRVADGGAYDNFGQSVAVSGNKIIVGAPGSDISAPSSLTKKINGGEVAPQAAEQGGVYFYTNALSPTAAGVSISGRVQTAAGAGLQNATVQLMLANGETRTMRTGAFGNYGFDNIGAGQVIIVSVISKKYQFSPQIVSITDNLTDMNFIAEN